MTESLAVHQSRQEVLRRLANEATVHDINARIVARRAADETDRQIVDAHADHHANIAREAREKLERVAQAHGTTAEAVLEDAKDLRRQTVEQHLEQWRATRDVHQDMVDHPEMYDHTDHGGRPLVMSEQRGHLQQYDAAIAEAEDELTRL